MITVNLGDRSYPIMIDEGALDQLSHHIIGYRRVAIVTDRHVNHLHGDRLRSLLDQSNISHITIEMAAGEGSKSFAGLERVVREMLKARFERKDLVIALGGGVMGDLAGFAASIMKRGMDFIQIPTTLLSQVDSSVGGKTGINTAEGKNLIGAFMQPKRVIIDPLLLKTLPPREFNAGYAEIVKIALVQDAKFYQFLDHNIEEIKAHKKPLIEAISRAVQAKASIVERDETEQGERALLNFGHTFAHAFEKVMNYESAKLIHGEAVAMGIVCAIKFSAEQGFCPKEDIGLVEMHLKKWDLPITFSQLGAKTDDLMSAIAQDKKVSGGNLTFILTKGVGQGFIAKNVNAKAIHDFLARENVTR